jgi:hypothetical protein
VHAESFPGAEDAFFWTGERARRERCGACTLTCSPRADIFVASQHKAATLPQKWWSDAFRQAVADIGHTVLVLQPWSAPVPLTRSWCLVRRSTLRCAFA